MSSTVKKIFVVYDPINNGNYFTNGDCISGRITLETAKDCQIDSLSVKLKGKAEVKWTERHGQTSVTYHAKNKYFSIKQFFIQQQKGQGQDYQRLLTGESGQTYCNVVAPGIHTYPFTFQIPQQDTPSSFHSSYGKIIYILEARLSRSMRIDSKAQSEFNFVSKGNLNAGPMVPELMIPQRGTKDKKMLFSSGTVTMDVNIDKLGYHQGQGIKVVASIQNSSSREIKPKYCLYRKRCFFARGKRKVSTKDILKEVGDPIPPSASQTVTRIIHIPRTLETSILNCNILTSEYKLRVYLDVRYAKDPEIKFPVVILHASQSPENDEVPPYSSFDFEPSSSDFPTPWIPNQPAWNSPPPPYPTSSEPSEPPPAYGMYPSLSNVDGKS